MQKIKRAIYTTLSSSLSTMSLVDNIKEYDNNDLVINDAEKLVYNNSAIAIGSQETEQTYYSKGFDLNKHKVSIFLFAKSSSSKEEIEVNFSSCSKILRDSDLGLTDTTPLVAKPIYMTNISKVSHLYSLSDKIKYQEMECLITEIVDITT